jgi:pimeloyl-ACP methyl ester carboxylesterase
MVKQASLYLDLEDGERIHLRRIQEQEGGIPVLMIHGSVEDGRIFYSKSNKGYGPYLARNGYDVFVPDLRGRGRSTPKISRQSKHGQYELINTDIPQLMKEVKRLSGQERIHVVGHSWGGVLLLSYMARYGCDDILSLVTFGSKRQLTVHSLQRWYMLNFGWHGLGNLAIAIKGYLPSKALKMGSDNEPTLMFREINAWLGKRDKWIDTRDGFDYGKALKERNLPPSLYFAGADDHVLGHPHDVRLLIEESGSPRAHFKLLGTSEGLSRDYGHNDMLTHPAARQDVFPLALQQMKAAESL